MQTRNPAPRFSLPRPARPGDERVVITCTALGLAGEVVTGAGATRGIRGWDAGAGTGPLMWEATRELGYDAWRTTK